MCLKSIICWGAIGTPPRQEYETKIAFKVTENIKAKDLFLKIVREVGTSTLNESYYFPKILDKKYRYQANAEPMVFEDTYLDDEKFNLRKNNSVYRLRYRFKNQGDYWRHQLIPFVSQFYPVRSEIQAKLNYKKGSTPHSLVADETRLEFRPEASPFNQGLLASPPPPWPKKKFLQVAMSGKYLDHSILPIEILRKKNDNLGDLSPVVVTTTERYRSHLSVPGHPWGTGPNPEQVFILSLDIVEVKNCLKGNCQKGQRYAEIEIEIERNVSTMIEQLLDKKKRPKLPQGSLYAGEFELLAISFSQKAYEALQKDLVKLSKKIINILSKSKNIERESLLSKYERVLPLH